MGFHPFVLSGKPAVFSGKNGKPLAYEKGKWYTNNSKKICGGKEWVKTHSLLLHRHKSKANEV